MSPTLPFLALKSELGNLIRKHDWTATGLGHPGSWPKTLTTKLNTIMNSSFPMFLFWGNEQICFYNDAFRPYFGNEGKHPAIGKKGEEVWKDIWHFLNPLITQVMTTGNSAWFEDQHVPFYRNGKTEDIYWTFSCSAVTDENDEVNGVVMICTETTEKVNLVRQLEESNHLYSFAIDASDLGTWDLDPTTNKFLANDRVKNWFGLDSHKEIDLPMALQAIAEKDRQRVADEISRMLQWESSGTYDIEYAVCNLKTGEERQVRAKGKATFDENKRASRFNGTLQDITAEAFARNQNQKLSVLVENSVDLMAILRMDGKNSYINKAGREILGIDEDADVTQIPISEFHTPEQLAFVESEILPNVMKNGKWAGEFGIRNGKTGELIPLYNNCHRIDDERTGEPIGVGTVMRDIRPEVNVRQRLEKLVQERTHELMKANELLEEKNKDLSSFAFVSSHDLQEPLRKIQAYISLIEHECPPTEKGEKYFNTIKRSAVRMQTLIRDLLSFSRTGTEELQFEPTDIMAVFKETIEEFRSNENKITLSTDIVDNISVNAMPFQIQQIFSNLISNSIKFSHPDRSLEIKIRAELITKEIPKAVESDKCYKITVRDNGIGFESEYKEKIFEVFQRLHPKGVYEGTGIGLSICKRIMDNHRGIIAADSKPGEGAVFELYFPVDQQEKLI